MRAYTITEIDALRDCCERKYLYGTYGWGSRPQVSRSYMESDKIKAVEEMARTLMLAGLTAKDLLAEIPAQLAERVGFEPTSRENP